MNNDFCCDLAKIYQNNKKIRNLMIIEKDRNKLISIRHLVGLSSFFYLGRADSVDIVRIVKI